jgi:Sulfotransferase family
LFLAISEVGIPENIAHHFNRARAHLWNGVSRFCDPDALAHYNELGRGGYNPNAHIDALVQQKLIYVNVPKNASTSIKMILSRLVGRKPMSLEQLHKRKYSGLQSPFQVGMSAFYRLATDSTTLRFSFVRNPYERLVSAWADKFQDRRLVSGNSFIEKYLAGRREIDPRLPHGEHSTLKFADFVTYATATASLRVDAHWAIQDDILSMPRLPLDFVGHVETFTRDIGRVLDHVHADPWLRRAAVIPMRASPHHAWPLYYTQDIADRVYRAYEPDFDRFGYSRTISFAQRKSA